jgi:hypothetical protein
MGVTNFFLSFPMPAGLELFAKEIIPEFTR